MPCKSDRMEPNVLEKELSMVACCLDELNNHIDPYKKRHKEGYHPKVYSNKLSDEEGNVLVATLCSKCKKLERQGFIKDKSLELQMWWRDHKKKDEQRERDQELQFLEERDQVAFVHSLMNRLTPSDKKLLLNKLNEDKSF